MRDILTVYLNVKGGDIPQIYTRYVEYESDKKTKEIHQFNVMGSLGTFDTTYTYSNLYEVAKKTGKKIEFKFEESQSKQDLKNIEKKFNKSSNDILATAKYNLVDYIKHKINPDNKSLKKNIDEVNEEIHKTVKLYD